MHRQGRRVEGPEALESRYLLSASPHVEALYAGPAAAGQRQADDAMLRQVVAGPYQAEQLARVGIGPGVLDGSAALPLWPFGVPGDLAARLLMRLEVLLGALPRPSPDAVFVIFGEGKSASHYTTIKIGGREYPLVVEAGKPPSPGMTSNGVSFDIVSATLSPHADSPLLTGQDARYGPYSFATTKGG